MLKRFVVLSGAVLAFALIARTASAQSAGSFAGDFMGPQGVMKIFTTTVCSSTDSGCVSGATGSAAEPLMTATIKVSGASSKSLLLMGSLEDMLITNTSNSGGGKQSTSTATGTIVVTPLVTGANCPSISDGGCPVYPSKVTFASRSQTLTADLGSCTVSGSSTTLTCTDTDTIDLILSTTSANSFNFLMPNMGAGTYTVTFNVAIETSATSDSLSAGATAQAAVDAASLGVLTVQTQTPFNSLTFSD